MQNLPDHRKERFKKMKKITKTLALVLALLMAISCLASCGKDETETEDTYVYEPNYVDIGLAEDAYISNSALIGSDFYFITSEDTGETATETYTDENGEEQTYEYNLYASVLYKVDALTGEKTKLTGYTAPTSNGTVSNGTDDDGEVDYSTQSYSNVQSLCATKDGGVAVLWSETTTKYNLPTDFNPETDSVWMYPSTADNTYYLDILDETGALAERKTLIEKQSDDDGYYYVVKVLVDKDGNVYLFEGYSSVTVLSPDMTVLCTLEPDNGISNISLLPDGTAAAICYATSGGMEIRPIDIAKKDFGTGVPVSTGAGTYFDNVFAGAGDYDLVATTSGGILGITADGSCTQLLSWLDCDMSPDSIDGVCAMENGDFVVFAQTWLDSGDEWDLVYLVKTKVEPGTEKKIITLATMNMDSDMRNMVSKFNKSNTEYRIKVTDYSQYATEEDYSAGVTKLNTEIVSGNIPDIFLLTSSSQIPIERYAGKGILEDLTPYIERDFGADGIVEDFFKSLRKEDGSLYEIYSNFTFTTAVGIKNTLGDGSTLTVADIKEKLAQMPEGATVFSKWTTKTSALYSFVYSNMNSFVDWATGECKFNSDEFINLVEFVNSFPADDSVDWDDEDFYNETDFERIMTGKQLLADVNVWSLTDFRAETFYTYGKDVTFVGTPGIGNTFSSSGIGYAMSAKSEYKEAVWEFISQIISEEYQKNQNRYGYYNGIPTNTAVFEDMMKAESTPTFGEGSTSVGQVIVGSGSSGSTDVAVPTFYEGATNEKGEKEVPMLSRYIDDNTCIDVYAMTDYEKEVIEDILKNTTVFARYDTSLSSIISEELEPVFKGEKSAADAAAMIQSRATIYVNEQR